MEKNTRFHRTWNESYKELLIFIKKNDGEFDFEKLREYDLKLYYWVNRQLNLDYMFNLSQEHKDKLLNAGLCLNRRDDDFLRHYNVLKEYYLENGNSNIPTAYHVGNIKLGHWANYKRRAYAGFKNTKITKTEIMYLNKLEFDWNPSETIILNKCFTPKSYMKYNGILDKRVNEVLRDLAYENDTLFNSIDDQKEVEKIMLKRIFR